MVEEARRAGLYRDLWQSFAVLPAVRTVGLMGVGRTYAYPIVIRAVRSDPLLLWPRPQRVEPGHGQLRLPPRLALEGADAGDEAALADGLVALLEDEPRRRALGERARQVAEERYSWRRIAERLVEIYDSLADAPVERAA